MLLKRSLPVKVAFFFLIASMLSVNVSAFAQVPEVDCWSVYLYTGVIGTWCECEQSENTCDYNCYGSLYAIMCDPKEGYYECNKSFKIVDFDEDSECEFADESDCCGGSGVPLMPCELDPNPPADKYNRCNEENWCPECH